MELDNKTIKELGLDDKTIPLETRIQSVLALLRDEFEESSGIVYYKLKSLNDIDVVTLLQSSDSPIELIDYQHRTPILTYPHPKDTVLDLKTIVARSQKVPYWSKFDGLMMVGLDDVVVKVLKDDIVVVHRAMTEHEFQNWYGRKLRDWFADILKGVEEL